MQNVFRTLMISKLRYIIRFIGSSLIKNQFDTKTSSQLSKISKKCLGLIQYSEREDLRTEHFESCIAHILGVYSYVVSYHESISFLSLAGHSLNSLTLLRSQLESYLIFYYLISQKTDIKEIENRVESYLDWISIKMYLNSKKSKNFELFTINPELEPYVELVEETYFKLKEKYKNTPEKFKNLEKSQSFLKNKREIAKQADIEELYLAIFSETSATVHMADLSDRMIPESWDDFDGYIYKFSTNSASMMLSGVSNILMTNALIEFMEFFEFPNELRKKLIRKISLVKKHIA